MRSQNEDELIRLAKQGDGHAFTALVKPLRDKLVRHVSHIVGNPDDAEDVVQVALMRASRSLGQFRGESAFSTWLTQIARNTALNVRRTHLHDPLHLRQEPPRDREHTGLDEALRFVPDTDTPEGIAEANQRYEEISRALDALPPGHRECFELYNADGLTYEEISARLEVPVGTVRSRIHRARKAVGLL